MNSSRKIETALAGLSNFISKEIRSWRKSSFLQYSQIYIDNKTALFEKKRKFNLSEYETLLEPYLSNGYRAISHLAYTRLPSIANEDKIVLMRHDVDHDIVTALKLAEWEQRNGICTTYCLLHTAWYYGEFRNGRYRHSQLLADSALALQEMGHEVSWHNNLIALALRSGADPVEVLTDEMAFFRGLGVDLCGSSAHGDILCRELGISNHQIFAECSSKENFNREITNTLDDGKAVSVRLGSVSMRDFGLTYEAYDIALDTYHYDVGGHMRTKKKPTRYRHPFGRPTRTTGSVVGFLTHPVWWDLSE